MTASIEILTESNVYELGIETTKILNNKQTELSSIKWTNGEANIDTEYSKLACDCCTTAWNIIKEKNEKYNKINIECTIPDINITFIYPNYKKNKYKIELKSSKSTKIPGSTIKTLNINQTLIFCLRPTNKKIPFFLKCSQYHSAMGSSNIDLF